MSITTDQSSATPAGWSSSWINRETVAASLLFVSLSIVPSPVSAQEEIMRNSSASRPKHLEEVNNRESTSGTANFVWQEYKFDEVATVEQLPIDLDVRLIPPPIPEQKIKVKLRSIGVEIPRISFDPDQD